MTTRYPRLATGLSRVTLWHRFAEVTINDAGNPIVVTHDTGADFAHYAQQNPPTLSSQSSQLVQLQAGAWQMRAVYNKGSNCGICQLYWLSAADGTFAAIGSALDMYGAGFNQVHTGTFTIPMTAPYRITWSNTGKNAASSNYAMPFILTELWRTGD